MSNFLLVRGVAISQVFEYIDARLENARQLAKLWARPVHRIYEEQSIFVQKDYCILQMQGHRAKQRTELPKCHASGSIYYTLAYTQLNRLILLRSSLSDLA